MSSLGLAWAASIQIPREAGQSTQALLGMAVTRPGAEVPKCD